MDRTRHSMMWNRVVRVSTWNWQAGWHDSGLVQAICSWGMRAVGAGLQRLSA